MVKALWATHTRWPIPSQRSTRRSQVHGANGSQLTDTSGQATDA